MPTDSLDVQVTDQPEQNRYVVTVDGAEAGFSVYTISNRFMTFTHLEVDPAHQGKGVASTLARESLRDARRREFQIIPVCPYVRDWLTKHPDFADDL